MVFFLRGSLGERLREAAAQRATRSQDRATPFEIGMVVASVGIVIVLTIVVNNGLLAPQSETRAAAPTLEAAAIDQLRE